MSRQSYPTRSQAREAAVRELGEGKFFRTTPTPDGDWKWHYEPGSNPVAEWAKGKDFVAWVETDWHRDCEPSVKVGVLVISCQRVELGQEDYLEIPEPFTIEPVTPELFETHNPFAKPAKATAGQRARSDVESPVKTVWRIAEEMAGAPRKDVIAACVAAGVNKATASTQVYRWSKSKCV